MLGVRLLRRLPPARELRVKQPWKVFGLFLLWFAGNVATALITEWLEKRSCQ